ncbi:MAG: hypothetical protein QOI83_4030, partial [Streptomycetaceae bacterium]|nr:hypothetical protein [Streptomycetaceae bacterium]
MLSGGSCCRCRNNHDRIDSQTSQRIPYELARQHPQQDLSITDDVAHATEQADGRHSYKQSRNPQALLPIIPP